MLMEFLRLSIALRIHSCFKVTFCNFFRSYRLMNTCKNLNFNLAKHNIKVKSLIWLWLHVRGRKGLPEFLVEFGTCPYFRAWQVLFSLNPTAAKPIKGSWRKSAGPGILEEVAIDVPGFLSSSSFGVVFLSSGQCSLGFSWWRRTGCTDEGDELSFVFYNYQNTTMILSLYWVWVTPWCARISDCWLALWGEWIKWP